MIVRPRTSVPLPSIEELGRQPPAARRYLDRRTFVQAYGADRADLAAVASFAKQHDLEVVRSSEARRSVVLGGRVADMSRAFSTRFATYDSPHGVYRGRTGVVHLPKGLAPVVQAVLGLDDRPQAHPQIRAHADPARGPEAFTPNEIARLYRFPKRLDGSGQRIAIIELGGGYRVSELRRYFDHLGVAMPKIKALSVDGVRNRPGVHAHADSEVMLDIEVIGAIVPGAELLVYFAPLTDRGFIDAVLAAVFDEREPSVLSISWGDAESNWSGQARQVMDQAFQAAALMGISVCCVSGDNGWTDGISGRRAHVDYPAASPYVLACGGTRLEVLDGERVERVWNDANGSATGGGVSEYYPVPSWQLGARVPRSVNPSRHRGRGVPDVAGNADPDTGYRIRLNNAEFRALGGTSAVGPLWAALIAQMNERLGTRLGFLNPLLYEAIAPEGFNSVVKGSNGAYRARLHWDACTGHGTPDGERLLAALSAA